jgi:phosphate starvation-inducible protein PhoH and related proteins
MKNKKRQDKDNKGTAPIAETKVDTSPIIHQKSKLKIPLNIRKRPDLTDKQKELLNIILNSDTKAVFISGGAGTAKTYTAIQAALQLLSDKRVSDLIYLRSVVESSDSHMGFLPGTSDEKMSPYLVPLMDKLIEFLPSSEIDLLKKEKRISGLPINFLRGLSFNATVIILDEAQNMTSREIFTVLTRVGEFSKILILGDPDQSDLKNKSGFLTIMQLLNDGESRDNGIFSWTFTDDDVVRSKLVKFLLKKLKNKY